MGLSGDPARTAYAIADLLHSRGKRVVPIHPDAPELFGERVRDARRVPFEIDVVDVFRRSESAGRFVGEAITIGAGGSGSNWASSTCAAFERAEAGCHGDGHLPRHRMEAARDPPDRLVELVLVELVPDHCGCVGCRGAEAALSRPRRTARLAASHAQTPDHALTRVPPLLLKVPFSGHPVVRGLSRPRIETR